MLALAHEELQHHPRLWRRYQRIYVSEALLYRQQAPQAAAPHTLHTLELSQGLAGVCQVLVAIPCPYGHSKRCTAVMSMT